MNRLILILYSIVLCGFASCGRAGNSNEIVKSIEKADTCKSDSNNTYEVYIPKRDNSAEKLPLLVIIDAHGSGQFALNKFKQGANHYPTVLIASNLIKNGFEDYEGAIRNLIEDVRQKYPIGEMVFMTGFSGGARMALGYALTHQLNGLILCGALANSNQINAVNCPIISISGMDDFNFMETAQFLFQEQLIPDNLKIELTNGSHNWPDSPMLADALGFLRLSCQSRDIPSPSKPQINMYCQGQQSRIDSLKQNGDFLGAVLIARNMSSTKPFNSDMTFASAYNDVKTNPEYISQLNRIEKCLNLEVSVRQSYLEAFRTKDSLWWRKEIIASDEKINTEPDAYTKDMYRRIKGFWGIACYSFCKQAVASKDADLLKKILPIYQMLEPENADMFYFSSFPYFWKGDNEAALTIIIKAIKFGFSDRSQLKKDFPEWITSKLW